MALPIALQLYTVREELAADPAATLQQVADAGYRHVELAGLHDVSAERFEQMLDDAGLTALSAHEPADVLCNDPAPAIERARLFGYRHIACSFHFEQRDAADAYRRAAGDYDRIGKALSDAGMVFSYHNHGFEFERLASGVRGFDVIMNETDPQHVKSQLDVFWVQHGGEEPIARMRSLGDRVSQLHLKDMSPERNFTEIGTGVVDLAAVVEAAGDTGAECMIVEQDSHWAGDSGVQSARISLDNLSKIVG